MNVDWGFSIIVAGDLKFVFIDAQEKGKRMLAAVYTHIIRNHYKVL